MPTGAGAKDSSRSTSTRCWPSCPAASSRGRCPAPPGWDTFTSRSRARPTLGAALRQAEHGAHAQRTFRFRHTGNLQTKFAEARQVLGMTIDYQQQFKALADRLAREPIAGDILTHATTLPHKHTPATSKRLTNSR